jgi:hypothetical protein
MLVARACAELLTVAVAGLGYCAPGLIDVTGFASAAVLPCAEDVAALELVVEASSRAAFFATAFFCF